MNNQKFFLIVAILLSLFLLKEQWDMQHEVDSNGNLIYQKQAPVVSEKNPENVDVPTVVNTNTSIALPNTQQSNKGEITTITTDLLTLEVSHKGATIINSWMNDYPTELGSSDTVQLLNNKSGVLFQAQSGLLPQDKMPTHHSQFNSANSHYEMNGDTLSVPFTWTG